MKSMKQPLQTARTLAGCLFLCAAVLLGGCATPQTKALMDKVAAEKAAAATVAADKATAAVAPGQSAAGRTASAPLGDALPSRRELDAVPYYAQDTNQCGPATLAMAMGAAGTTIDPKDLEQQVYLPDKAGSLQVEMLAATRRHGLIGYAIDPQLEVLLGEVAAGRPVIVLENLAFNWYPKWHYAVVIGYDLDSGDIILRSGAERRQVLPLTTFEHLWARSQYWGMLVLPPDQLPRAADENRYVAAAVALEGARQPAAANAAYRAAVRRWPRNLAALMGLGNTAYALGDLKGAEQAFRAATRYHPDAAVAFNNLADTLARGKRYPEALRAAEEAVRLGGDQQAVFAQTLAEIRSKMSPRKAGKPKKPIPTKPRPRG